MNWLLRSWCLVTLVCLGGALLAADSAASFTVATYNLENYIDGGGGGRVAKPADARAKVRESIRALKPDVLAVQEIGTTNVLLELRASLNAEGLDFPYWEHVRGWDTNIFVAVLSRYPITARRPHTRESFLLRGRRFQVSRGFLEVDIQVHSRYSFTLLTAHLKSRRLIAAADEAEMREQEAMLLRERVDAVLRARPKPNLIVLGDFNDTKDSKPVQALLGKGVGVLVDTRPAERNGDDAPAPNPRWDPRQVTWTHFYGKEDSYDRVDYILLSAGMAREWDRAGTYVLALPNWGVASDHRPLIARFHAQER
jgi:endonuclease/exonuclease/phosphatase family metal-dependent hydrolase